MSFGFYYLIAAIMWLLYGWSFSLYWKAFFKKQELYSHRASWTHKVALLFHGGLLLFLGIHYNRCPLGTPGEALLFCCFLISLAYWLSELFSGNKHLGIFTVGLLFVGITLSCIQVGTGTPKAMEIDSLLAFHIIASLTAYACFSIAFILSLMYALLFKKLKDKEFDIYFQKLPSLVILERFSFVWVSLGVTFMSVASLIGTYWSHQFLPNSDMSPREIGIYSVLILFLLSLLSHKFFQFKGVRFAIGNLVGFGLLVLTQVLRVHGFHN